MRREQNLQEINRTLAKSKIAPAAIIGQLDQSRISLIKFLPPRLNVFVTIGRAYVVQTYRNKKRKGKGKGEGERKRFPGIENWLVRQGMWMCGWHAYAGHPEG